MRFPAFLYLEATRMNRESLLWHRELQLLRAASRGRRKRGKRSKVKYDRNYVARRAGKLRQVQQPAKSAV